jgi:serine/threonine protein kinase
VDQYAFGVLLWELLTGEQPWSELDHPMQVQVCNVVRQKRKEFGRDAWSMYKVCKLLQQANNPDLCMLSHFLFTTIAPLQIIFAVGVQCQRLPIPADLPSPLCEVIKACFNDNPACRPPFSVLEQTLASLLLEVNAREERA